MSVWKTAVLGSLGLLLGAWSPVAHAQTCMDDSGCPKGFTCEVTGSSGCAEPAIACAPGQKCPDPPPCDPTEIRECEPGPCKIDSDCAAGMVCYTQKNQVCTGGDVPPCVPGAKCPEATPPDCKAESVSACTPRYQLPCTTDVSCGLGFTCKEEQSCTCSGSAGGSAPPLQAAVDAGVSSSSGGGTPSSSGSGSAPTPAIDGGQAKAKPIESPAADAGAPVEPQIPPDSNPTCSCAPTGEKSCDLNKIDCKQNGDCPATFTCVAEPTASVSCAPVPSGAADAAVPPCVLPPPAAPIMHCMPPYYGVKRGTATDAPGSLNGGSTAAVPQATGNVGSAATTTAPPTAAHDAAEDNGAASDAAHAKACSVSSPGSRGAGSDVTWLSALSVFGLIWLRRRRG